MGPEAGRDASHERSAWAETLPNEGRRLGPRQGGLSAGKYCWKNLPFLSAAKPVGQVVFLSLLLLANNEFKEQNNHGNLNLR